MIRVHSSLRIRKNLYQTWSLNRMKTWKELWNFLSPKSLTSHQNALIWILSANHSIHQIVSIVHQGHKASHRDWSIDYHCDKFIPKTDTSWVGEFALSWFDEIPKHRRKKAFQSLRTIPCNLCFQPVSLCDFKQHVKQHLIENHILWNLNITWRYNLPWINK